MKFVNRIFGWLRESNRPKHIKAGIVIFACGILLLFVTMLVTFHSEDMPFYFMSRIALIGVLQALFTVCVAMCAVECIQESMGGKWDWLDVAAGVLLPFIVTAVAMICMIALK